MLGQRLVPVLRACVSRATPPATCVPRHVPVRRLRTLPAFSLEGKTCSLGWWWTACIGAGADVASAARGLGKEFLTAFALSGAKGACVDLSLPSAQAAVDAITSHVSETTGAPPPELRPYGCNATVEAAVHDTWSQIVTDFGHVDVLVTAAGIVDNVEAEKYDFARWRKMMDINVDGTWLFAREAGRHMIERQVKGSIILVASMSATICVRPQKQAAYNASKGAVKMLMKSLSTEWAPYGIRVNAISPGYMYTDLIKGLLEKEGKEKADLWVKDIPLGRMGHPSELQGSIVYMASDASSYLTGSDLIVDGGYTAW